MNSSREEEGEQGFLGQILIKGRIEIVDVEQTEKRLEMINQRLDNIDSVVTALVERIMKQPLSLEITCPKCGSIILVSVVGNIRKK